MANALSIELLSPPDMFRGQTYEHAAVVGDFVFLAGQVSRNAAGDTVAPNDTAGQTVQLYANLRRVLKFAGCEPADVSKVTTYLVATCVSHASSWQRIGSFSGRTDRCTHS